MPFITTGTGDDLILTSPTSGTKSWGTNFLNNYTTPIVTHDHTGGGKGQKIATAAIAADAVNQTKIKFAKPLNSNITIAPVPVQFNVRK